VAFVHQNQIQGFTAKQFLANDGIHYEKRWFHPWPKRRQQLYRNNDVVFPIGELLYELDGLKIGIEICEDAWSIGRPAQRYEEKDVDIILNPSASHFGFKKTLRRQELVKSSSREFNCIYCYANLLGNEAGRAIYDGEILIAHDGEIIAQSELLSLGQGGRTDIGQQAQALSKNEEFSKAVSLALFDYLRKSKSKGFVLSLSGGADSSSIAVLIHILCTRLIKRPTLLKKELGLENISVRDLVRTLLTTAYQGTKNSSNDTRNSAQDLAFEIGASHHEWNIDEPVSTYSRIIEEQLGRPLTWEDDDIALQNIQARSRSPIIWMLTNIKNSLLLATSNRSEGTVGYTTMDGDTSGSISPIAGVDKPFIRSWLIWAQEEYKLSSLQHVNNLNPSAELRPLKTVQEDEDDLMPYNVLTDIENLAIKEKLSPLQVYQSLQSTHSQDQLKGWITKFFKLWSRNQWKRERLAPSFHLDDHNVDPKTWCRFPILSGGFEEELKELT
jgi:NAD+ synthase (glutamine-hydrolysing)